MANTTDVHRSIKSKSSPWKKALTYGSLVILGAGVGVGGSYAFNSPTLSARTTDNPIIAQRQDINQTPGSPQIAVPTNFVTQVVEKVGPAVVRIDAARTVTQQTPEIFNDPFFRQFFGSQIPQTPNRQVQRGTGSGFIISSEGKIITNAHVVDGADRVTVTLKDGRTFTGQVLGTDPLTDIAVVKIEANNLPTAKVGNSDRLQVGEWAIAIGNPLGLDNTVTTGIVSGTGRSSALIGAGDKRLQFIQTDAAINPGNSGGPLLDQNGEVIGVNTAIIQNAQGIGFAIPINKAQEIADQLIAKGKVDHPYLGIQMAQITPDIKQKLQQAKGWRLSEDQGVVIIGIVPNSPAARSGIREGDVITAIGEKSIDNPTEVQQEVDKTQVGSRIPLQISRDGRIINLDVEVGVLPNQVS
ncbi:2-alkenal reductase [Gloeothece citriformis PCC 7424]|uniref:2-alkenal reductase n=1 Tax=Gloeothece citriformis (strain PCC 7424) TaxID=65393 RepID=B7K801_GLOC7|nr:HhoA/HhoB/HtrA family serine endopeptidase [Gloeothece citriformis]ACK68489.1 2-alkenal reductase [Gloeothece citriformis PCC 7424]